MFTVTSETLLLGLKDPDNHAVWHGYVDRYRPVLVRWFRRAGLADADADDVAQEALLAFASAYRDGKYDPARGRLRAWLFGIARTNLRAFRRRRAREPQPAEPGEGTGLLERIEDEDRLQALWEEEWRAAVLRQALDEVRREVTPSTFEAFELFAREGLRAGEVAARLGTTENAVFGAKRRVLSRLRELLPEVERVW